MKINKFLFIILFLPIMGIGCVKNDKWTGMYYFPCKECDGTFISQHSIGSLEECYDFGISVNKNKYDSNLTDIIRCGKDCEEDENLQYNCTESVTKSILEILDERGEVDISDLSIEEKINLNEFDENNDVASSTPKTINAFWGSNYSVDKDYVYYKNEIIEGATVKDFQILEAGYAKDGNLVYHMGQPLPQYDASTFYAFKERSEYVKDKNGVYIFGKKIQGADSDSFIVLGNTIGDGYQKDKNYVYCHDNSKIEWADPASFKHVPSKPFGTDSNYVFYYCEVVKGADPKTFKVVNYQYVVDKNNVWEIVYSIEKQNFILNKIPNANPDAFDFEPSD